MKKLLALLGASWMCVGVSGAADTIARWTYENQSLTVNVTNQSVTGLLPELGTGVASGWHASAATVFSSPVGNGSAESFSANTWDRGDYYQFELSTAGYTDISVSWDQTRSGTGPSNFDFAWSVNGTDWTIALDNYTVFNTTWNGTTPSLTNTYAVNLSLEPALNNAPNVYFRLICDQTGVAVAGTSRHDNFTVSGTAVPEPGVASLGGLALLGWLAWSRLRRRS